MSDDIFNFPSNQTNTHGKATIHIMDCIDYLDSTTDRFDAIITDPPYEIGLHGKAWDSTGIAVSPKFWKKAYNILKPGGFVAAFSAQRKYHGVAAAMEEAGFIIYPFLYWNFENGLPKPVNLSELFDRENKNRKVIGSKSGSGFTKANVDFGAQNRENTSFLIHERHTTAESKQWEGYFYGVNCMRPMGEPIILAQRPISEKTMVENIRLHGTGALNLAELARRQGTGWAETILRRPKARKKDHGFSHPSVKNVDLMGDLCSLCCPSGGVILDMFGGTGTTAEAAISLGFDCTIIESDESFRDAIISRVERSILPSTS